MQKITKFLKYAKVGYHYFRNRQLTGRSINEKKMYTGPWTAYLSITNKCNCTCIQCPSNIAIEAKKEKQSENLTLDEYYNLVDQLVDSGCFRIGLSGGEPLIYKEKVLSILEKINERAYSQIVTNGSLLDSEFLEKYDKIGGGHITISIDGMSGLHDKIRGKKGLFKKVESLFSDNGFKNIIFKSTFVLFNENVEDLLPTAKYFIERKIPFFISPYENYNRKHSLEECRKDPLWIQNDKETIFKDSLSEIINLKKNYPHIIINNTSHLQEIENYFLKPEKALAMPKKCYFGYRTVYITPKGDVETCNGIIGSIRNKKFFEIWDSEEFHDKRINQLRCKKNCMLGCIIDHSYFDLLRLVIYQTFKGGFRNK